MAEDERERAPITHRAIADLIVILNAVLRESAYPRLGASH
jgi:hypothetical protein